MTENRFCARVFPLRLLWERKSRRNMYDLPGRGVFKCRGLVRREDKPVTGALRFPTALELFQRSYSAGWFQSFCPVPRFP